MAWTYSGDPASSILDKVRFLTGDTDTNDQLLQDAEILSVIAIEANEIAAAAGCCEVLATKFSRKCDRKLGRIMYLFASQQYANYEAQSVKLRRMACQFNAPSAGGLSIGSEIALANDLDRKQPVFSRDMMAAKPLIYPRDITE